VAGDALFRSFLFFEERGVGCGGTLAIVTCGATGSFALRGGFSKKVTWLAAERVAERGGFHARRGVHGIMERGVVLEFLGEISHERGGGY
jgi:hypothetical protein